MWNFLYLAIDLGCISIPFLFSFHPKIRFDKEWKAFLPAMIMVAIFFLIWDEFFTQLGVWGFNPAYLTGIYLGHLPLEEILFFICIPYACVFTYFTLNKISPQHILQRYNQQLLWLFFIVSTIIAIIYRVNWYTATTFGLLAVFLLVIYFTEYKKYFANILRGYLAIVPFFFMSNGLLTGSLITDQVVWYNNTENIGVRMISIPVEDIFYGFLLIIMNIIFYEMLKSAGRERRC